MCEGNCEGIGESAQDLPGTCPPDPDLEPKLNVLEEKARKKARLKATENCKGAPCICSGGEYKVLIRACIPSEDEHSLIVRVRYRGTCKEIP